MTGTRGRDDLVGSLFRLLRSPRISTSSPPDFCAAAEDSETLTRIIRALCASFPFSCWSLEFRRPRYSSSGVGS